MIRINNEILEKAPGFRFGYLELENVIVKESPEAFWTMFDAEIERTKEHFDGRNLTDDEYIQGMRIVYRKWKMDPTRYRPSAERLHRRILRGLELYRINTAVDVCNYVSLNSRLPLGLYDRDRVKFPMELRFGRPEESYLGITNQELSCGGKAVVCDSEGPIGSATTDSRRTGVGMETTAIVLLVNGPELVPDSALNNTMEQYYTMLNDLQETEIVIKEQGISG